MISQQLNHKYITFKASFIMKTKRFYDPPRVETMNLHAEGVLCASGNDPDSEATVGFGWMNSSDNDLSGLF